jgi:N6-L-threonylcarbamoyladenine synthase
MVRILGIESTCDETGAAVVEDGWRVRSDVVASQAAVHARYRGVVPEIASRHHIENILPVVQEAIEGAGVGMHEVDAIAVAHRPGLIGSLLIGVTAAKTLAWALGRPLIGVDHVHAHLYSVMLAEQGAAPAEPAWPAVGLVVSGGHTALYRMGNFDDVELIGSTIDDAVGEAYDKVAAILGLGYPGGPIIDRLARQGDTAAVKFPRTMLGRESLDFSFSGLKTAVLYHVRGFQGRQRSAEALAEREKADVAASFQAACVEVILKKVERAVAQVRAKSVIVGGGVSANSALRAALGGLAVAVRLPSTRYCTDNAAMSAGLAELAFRAGRFAPLSLDAVTHSQFRDG